MALDANITQLNITKEAVAIMTIKTSNLFAPKYQPNVKKIEVIPIEKTRSKYFKVSKSYGGVKKEYNEYLVSFQLPPGKYKIGLISGGSSAFPIFGSFKFPLDTDFELDSNSIIYIGHLEMKNRKRIEGERRSGSIIPFLDQYVTGFFRGTFDIKVSDNYIEDIKKFNDKYPSLKNHKIKKKIAVQTKSRPH